MTLINGFFMNIYSIIIIIIIYAHSPKQGEKESSQDVFFNRMLKVTILVLIVDMLSRFDGHPNTIYATINHIGNFMLFLVSPLMPSHWILYAYEQTVYKAKNKVILIVSLTIINGINVVFLIFSLYGGYFYSIDAENNYHRGPLYFLHRLILFILMVISFKFIIKNHKAIEKKQFFSLIFFPIPPAIGFLIQTFYYGISFTINSMVISLLIIFLNIQNNNIYTDYLTGVNNRKKLELYLKEKINSSTKDKTFSAIMIDMNKFKYINDTFGHAAGDRALQIAAKLLSSCVRTKDFIARFGGDEFCIVVDIDNEDNLEDLICRINNCVEKYNNASEEPYKISFSMGYAVYDYNLNMKPDEFQKQIDTLMYHNKQNIYCDTL